MESKNGINVLSLFDGMSCGHIALDKCGIKINKYFASEIDKHAIHVTMQNYPETIQLGSVVNVNTFDLPQIDLLIGGSPCQSFSFAGKRKGMATIDETEILTLEHYIELKNDGFEFEGQSYLFWEYMRILNETKPKYFLLENVLMGEKWEAVLSRAIGVHPIEINSALVSAQNRRRLYWTNIGMEPMGLFGDLESIIKQPKDKKILLRDILQDNPNAKYYLSNKTIATIAKTKNGERSFDNSGKSLCLLAGYNKIGRDNQFVCEPVDEKYYLSDEMISKHIENTKKQKQNGSGFSFEPQFGDEKANTVTTKCGSRMTDTFLIVNHPIDKTTGCAIRGRNDNENKRFGCLEIRDDNKANALTLSENNSMVFKNQKIRKLTPIECERLQTIPDNYTNHVSDTQRYRMLGNGWTADVIAHIFNYLPFERHDPIVDI